MFSLSSWPSETFLLNVVFCKFYKQWLPLKFFCKPIYTLVNDVYLWKLHSQLLSIECLDIIHFLILSNENVSFWLECKPLLYSFVFISFWFEVSETNESSWTKLRMVKKSLGASQATHCAWVCSGKLSLNYAHSLMLGSFTRLFPDKLRFESPFHPLALNLLIQVLQERLAGQVVKSFLIFYFKSRTDW